MEQLRWHDLHQAQGAQFFKELDIEIPKNYGDPLKEYQAVREHAALSDLSYQGKFIISGPDAQTFLQGLISNDLLSATNEKGIYATLLTAKGKTVSDFYLFPLPEGYLMEVERGNAEKTKDHLMRFRLRSKVEISVPSWGKLLIAGPSSASLIEKTLGLPLPDMSEQSFFEKEVDGERFICIKRTVTGETDFHLYYPTEKMGHLWQQFFSEGKALHLHPLGYDALEILRIEAGKPRYGMELNEEVIPVEAGIQDEVISYSKGCFPGQEVVARIKTYGHVNRLLSGLALEGKVVPVNGSEVFQGDKKVGWVTSAGHSPFIGKVVAMGYVRRELANPGTEIRVKVDDETEVLGKVVSLPFYQKTA